MIIIHGAFDRHNYGDLLFPHVLQATIPPEMDRDVVFTACRAQSDLSRFGGVRTESLWEVLARPGLGPVFLLHAGGEVLPASKASVGARLIDPKTAKLVQSVLGSRALALGYRPFLRDAPPAPYVVDADLLPPGSSTVFNAVGGSSLQKAPAEVRDHAARALRSAALVGVRDDHTRQVVGDLEVAPRVVPDTATLVPGLFRDEIDDGFREIVQRIPSLGHSRYLVLHMNDRLARSVNGEEVVRRVARFAEERRLRVVLCTMGRAAFHDDPTYLRRLIDVYAPNSVEYVDGRIWPITGLLTHADLWIGSSLHGRIVSMASGTPRVSIVGGDEKVGNYARTWDLPSQAVISLGEGFVAGSVSQGLLEAIETPRASRDALRMRLTAATQAWLDEVWTLGTDYDRTMHPKTSMSVQGPASPLPLSGPLSIRYQPMKDEALNSLDRLAWRGAIGISRWAEAARVRS